MLSQLTINEPDFPFSCMTNREHRWPRRPWRYPLTPVSTDQRTGAAAAAMTLKRLFVSGPANTISCHLREQLLQRYHVGRYDKRQAEFHNTSTKIAGVTRLRVPIPAGRAALSRGSAIRQRQKPKTRPRSKPSQAGIEIQRGNPGERNLSRTDFRTPSDGWTPSICQPEASTANWLRRRCQTMPGGCSVALRFMGPALCPAP
jgi:hypothetical protein